MTARAPAAAPPSRAAGRRGRRGPDIAGCGALTRMMLRRDRIRLAVWPLLTLGILASLVNGVTGGYQEAAERRTYAENLGDSAAAAAFSGPLYRLTELGGIVVAESLTIVMFAVALAGLLLAVRYTRAEEETGRAELVSSAAVGRQGRLATALLVAGGLGLLAGLLAAVLTAAFGLPAAGCVAYGLAVTLVGWLFVGVGVLFAQVFEHSRTAIGASAGVFGASIVLRAIGDASLVADPQSPLRHLSWASPFGWAFQVRPFAGERWWVLLLPFACAVLAVAAAAALGVRRDVGAGLIPARPGRATATGRFGTAWALAWRLQRGAMIGWGIGVALFAVAFGSFAIEMEDMAEPGSDSAELLARLGGSASPADGWIAWTLSIAGMVTAVYAVSAVQRLRAEEDALRTDMVLAGAVRRGRWSAAHLAAAALGVAAIMIAAGLLTGLVYGLRAGDLGGQLPRVLGGALVQVPAALLTAAAAYAVHAYLPRLTSAMWALAIGAVLLTELGSSLKLHQAVLDLSPFTHTPKAPGGPVDAAPLLWFAGCAAVLVAAAAYRLRRRDIGVF
ncbi:ABC transporter permease [Actinomadura sp. NAK00032]|uniref:ABC transporter permease n=1 Tax=Actinomadura sp. NAK00032 TaxID=2742128 RepID=UPI0015903374|nr:ABC transporter permease [Actinomadura sp. NAK00032]QKW37574.1 ABC transporter permease [Actinomadura sp. NAK00032]